ncbi:MAG: tyrosine-type recombinase/integrase [Egibacteraceae bacterium]
MGTGEPVRLQVTGPLAPFEVAFRAELERAGYASRSSRALVRVMARLSSWLEKTGLQPDVLTGPVVANLRVEFSGLGPVLGFLRGIGVVPAAGAIAEATPVERVLSAFGAWLAAERGLAAESIRCYVNQARPFLASLPQPLDVALESLDAGRVTSFMLSHCRRRNTWSAQAAVTAIRSLLRFLHVAGHVPVGLAAAVPSVARWRLDTLPRGLDDGQVGLLLGSCDVGSVVGRRDYAVLTVLARLGLRGGEVAALQLGDIDWRGGDLAVRGKGNRIERLPLPVVVGEALARYVTGGRPHHGTGPVFLTVRAPYRGLTCAAVRGIVARACQRAGLSRLGGHRLRHTLASDMLRAGAGLAEVGQVLRHRSQLATATYAKVDQRALAVLARPWPGGRA